MDQDSQTLGSMPKFARKYQNRTVQRTGCSSCSERGRALPAHIKEVIRNTRNSL